MLGTWDFKDHLINSTTPQINRQKSARNLSIIAIDENNSTGIFLDPKKGTRNTATLTKCDCKDFNFSGNGPRKSFKPCMHIYRLAIELGLLDAKYEDNRAREKRTALKNQLETARLQSLNQDPRLWGAWHSDIHEAGIQKNRQYWGYFLLYGDEISRGRSGWVIHEYYVTLESCECADFATRFLPCKHIYAAALASGIELPLTQEEFIAAKSSGIENVFTFDDIQ